MKSSGCNTECHFFKWSEHGANYKAFCTKQNSHLCDMGACPGTELVAGMIQDEM